jgi:hypothetical protein
MNLDMNKSKFIIRLLGIVLCAFIILTSLRNRSLNESIWIEAEMAEQFDQPFEVVADSSASGGKAITSNMRSDELESSLLYEVEVSKSGKYHFWANCFWPGGCNNSFIVQFDAGHRFVFGNDKQQFDSWHWVKGPTIELSDGTHDVRIWNKEKFSKMDIMLLTLDDNYYPDHELK